MPDVMTGGAGSLSNPPRRKTDTLYRKGIEYPFALLYNLITTKNQLQSEVIIQQCEIEVKWFYR
jgi:hypothetical protein